MTIRIWHQSITDVTALPSYAASLEAIAERTASAGTTVAVHGVARGSYPGGIAPVRALRNPWAHHLLTTQIVRGVMRADREGFDAVTVSCFHDPGLETARSVASLPVLSACENSILAAAARGARPGLIALDAHQRKFLSGLVARHGLLSRVAGIVALRPAVTEHELESFDAETLAARVSDSAGALRDLGADLLIPAEGAFNSRLAEGGFSEIAGMPVLDSFAALIRQAEIAAGEPREPRAPEEWSELERATADELLSR